MSKYYVLTKDNNPTPDEEFIKYYYTGKNLIQDGLFIPGRSDNLSEAFKFTSKKKALKELESIKKCLRFTCNPRHFEVEAIER